MLSSNRSGNRRILLGRVGGVVLGLLALGLPLAGPAGAQATFAQTLAGPSIAEMYPSGLEYDAGHDRIVVADTGRDRIDFYTLSGTKVSEFGIHGAQNGQFDSPRDVAVDGQSSIYVADAGNNRIQKFDQFGNHQWTVGGSGTCQTCLNTPIGVTWDSANQVLLVASTGQNLIKAYDSSGAWKWTSPSGPTLGVTSPRDVSRGPDGRIWVTAYKQHQIKAYNVTASGVWTTTPAIVLGDGVTGGHGNGQLNFPYNVTFSPNHDVVYVSDTGNARIARWSLNGTQVTWLPQFGSRCDFPCPDPPADAGKFEHIRRVTTDGAGNVIAADLWGNGLKTFDPAGNQIVEIAGTAAPVPGFNQAYGVAVGASGTTYVVDRENQRIERFDAAGNFLNVAGGRGTGAGRVSWPEAAAVAPDGSVWLADTRNDRLEHWPANLATTPAVPSFGTTGSALGQFNYPEGLTVDSAGAVWVADTNNNRIQRYTPSTGTYTAFGSAGTTGGKFSFPKSVAVGGGAMYVADTGNNRIQKLGLDGSFIAQSTAALNGPEGIALAPDGSLWVADTGTHRIVHLSSALVDIGDGFGSFGTGTMQFSYPHSLAVDGSGRLLVADTYNSRVQVFTLSASPPPPPPPTLPTYSRQTSASGGVAPLYPAGGTTDTAGNRYVADSGGSRIVKLAPDGTQSTVHDVGWNDPRDIELDSDGTLWALDTSDHQVVHLTTSGAALATFGGAGVLNQPYGLSVGPSAVFVADTYNQRVVALDKSTGTTLWTQTTCASKAFTRPRDVGLGSDGNLYVADTDNNRIASLVAATGACLTAFGTQGTGNNGFKSPRSVVSDGAGGLWIADALNSRLKHVTNAGTFIGATSGGFGEGNGQFRSPHCVFLDQGQVDVCDTFNYRIQRFSVSASGVPAFASVLGGTRPADGGFNGAFAVAYAPNGDLYAVDWFNHRIERFNAAGTLVSTWGGYGSPNGSLIFPRGVTVTPDGSTVVVTDSENNRIDLFTAAGVYVSSVKPATGTALLRPYQTALAPDGTYWVADSGNNRAIHLNGAGTVLGTITGLTLPRGIAVDSGGNIYIANGNGNSVTKYSPAGTLLSTLATSGAGATNVKGPYGLLLSGTAGNERLYVADAGNNRVLVLTTTGGAVGSFGSAGSGNGQFSSPRAVAISPATADVAVADFANNRLSIWH
jgi:DNA-binding beta-propeller fold protein YncE